MEMAFYTYVFTYQDGFVITRINLLCNNIYFTILCDPDAFIFWLFELWRSVFGAYHRMLRKFDDSGYFSYLF